MADNRSKRSYILIVLFLPAVIPLLGLVSAKAAGPVFVPLTRDNMALVLERTVQVKLIPVTLRDESGFAVTLTELKTFEMDWERGEFKAEIAFEAEYVNPWLPIPFRQRGEAVVSGYGLISAEEQKFGGSLRRIDDIRFFGLLRIAHEPIRKLLNKKLTNKALWPGGAPVRSEVLTGDNWTEILQIGIAQRLPHDGGSGKTSYRIMSINRLTALDGPGRYRSEFSLEGRHQGLLNIGFQGIVSASASVWIVPDELRGKVRMEAVQQLDLKGVPALVDGIIRRSVSEKLKLEEFPFEWK